jgi:hypothetical protein
MLPELCSGKYLQRISLNLIEVYPSIRLEGLNKTEKKNGILGAPLLLIWCTVITPNYSVISWYYGLDVGHETYIACITY